MSYLALTDDELALLRFTCDLFFVEESPLYPLEEQQREPHDYAGAYHALVERTIIDPHGFRITDDALNRIAPVTECDARLVHVVTPKGDSAKKTEYWILDEIAVSYEVVGAPPEGTGARHLFGNDLDHAELIDTLARHLLPRRAGGDRLDLVATALEYLAIGLLLDHVRGTHQRDIPFTELKRIFHKRPPPEEMRPQAPLLPPGRRPFTRSKTGALVEDPAWDDALRSLLEKGALRMQGASVWMHSSLVDLATRELGERHTFVRTDFGEGDWFVRETTFVPVEGSLFFIGAKKGGIAIEELDGNRLRKALVDATGPLQRGAPAAKRLSELLVKTDPVKA
jgi:hypothetical protein